MESPDCLLRESLSGALGIGLDPCGAIRVEIFLAPNEEKTIVFLLGAAESPGSGAAARQPLQSPRKRRMRRWQPSSARWETALGEVRVETPDAAMNLLQNGWLLYQVISCRLWARTGFYQSGGAYGFRDQLQDALAVAATNPGLAKKQILLHARHQFTEGDVQHWWHEPQGSGVRTRFSDDFLWLPYVTAEYVRITGDSSILQEAIPFIRGAALLELERERYEKAAASSEKATLYEHCLRAIYRALRFGEHGLPLMGGGDWNDGMNTVGEKGYWARAFGSDGSLSSVLERFSVLCADVGDEQTAATFLETRQTLLANLERKRLGRQLVPSRVF